MHRFAQESIAVAPLPQRLCFQLQVTGPTWSSAIENPSRKKSLGLRYWTGYRWGGHETILRWIQVCSSRPFEYLLNFLPQTHSRCFSAYYPWRCRSHHYTIQNKAWTCFGRSAQPGKVIRLNIFVQNPQNSVRKAAHPYNEWTNELKGGWRSFVFVAMEQVAAWDLFATPRSGGASNTIRRDAGKKRCDNT